MGILNMTYYWLDTPNVTFSGVGYGGFTGEDIALLKAYVAMH